MFSKTSLLTFTAAVSAVALTLGCSSTPKTADAPPPSATPAPKTLPETLGAAVTNSPFRTSANVARDQYRHPLETLTFFGIRNDMTVVEIWPSSGWYTEILAPYLASKGHYIAAVSTPSNGEGEKSAATFKAWADANPGASAKMSTVEFNPPEKVELAPDNSVDMIVTFRNVHNWMKKGAAQNAFNAFFKALKPGGILGVAEHRAPTKGKQDPEAKNGYVKQDFVIAMAKKAGFKLEAKSEINANPKDTKDYPEGVWTLPPVYRLKDKDHAKYAAIGESDRMTLRFVKPKKKK